jgi:hypothetical protein
MAGFCGAALADLVALSRWIAQISLLATRLRDDASEIALNPVLVHAEGQGVTVVDALVVRRELSGHSGALATRANLESRADKLWIPRRAIAHLRSIAARCPGVTGLSYRPLKLATRRSSVALTPSLKSSEARSRVCSASS